MKWATPDWLLDSGKALGRPDHPDRDRVAEAVDSLPSHWRIPLEIVFYQGGSYADVAREFGLAGRQGGHYRTKRALRALRQKLEEMDDGRSDNRG